MLYLGSLKGRSQLILQAAPRRVITLIVADHKDVPIDADAEAVAHDLSTLDSSSKLTAKVKEADEIIRNLPFPEKVSFRVNTVIRMDADPPCRSQTVKIITTCLLIGWTNSFQESEVPAIFPLQITLRQAKPSARNVQLLVPD